MENYREMCRVRPAVVGAVDWVELKMAVPVASARYTLPELVP